MKICIFTIVKNEHDYLDEWIKYHIDLGIDHIFVFEDIDSKSHKEITDKYDKVTLNPILDIFEDENEKNKAIEYKNSIKFNPQHIYLKTALEYIKKTYDYDWCFVIDCDEFITLENKNDNLKNIIELYHNFDAFLLQWQCYGANGIIKKPNYNDKGVIDTYTKIAEGNIQDSKDKQVKTCYNLKKYKQLYFGDQHRPSFYSNFCKTDLKRYLYSPCYDKIYIRHYITKSWEEYVWKRLNRGYLNGISRFVDFFFDINPDMNNIKKIISEELKNIQLYQKETLIILPYKNDSAQGEELKLTLNAWKKFCTFDYHFIIIGTFDKQLINEFPWVEFIELQHIPKISGQYNQHLDVQHCLEYIMHKYDNKYYGFIWIADDNYAIKPFTLEDITTIHYHSNNFIGNKNASTSYWNHDKWKTRELLDKEKLPHYNYTTHYPCYFEFNKLKEIWEKFNMKNESYVLEDIYFNYFPHKEPVLDSTIRLGIWDNDIYKTKFKDAVNNPNIKFVCNSVEGWSKDLENDLWNIINI